MLKYAGRSRVKKMESKPGDPGAKGIVILIVMLLIVVLVVSYYFLMIPHYNDLHDTISELNDSQNTETLLNDLNGPILKITQDLALFSLVLTAIIAVLLWHIIKSYPNSIDGQTAAVISSIFFVSALIGSLIIILSIILSGLWALMLLFIVLFGLLQLVIAIFISKKTREKIFRHRLKGEPKRPLKKLEPAPVSEPVMKKRPVILSTPKRGDVLDDDDVDEPAPKKSRREIDAEILLKDLKEAKKHERPKEKSDPDDDMVL